MKSISLQNARQIVLSAQGLSRENHFGQGLIGAQHAIEHLGYVQIDTISVVERAHNHVWWTRVRDYKPSDLALLLENKSVFEYWSHAASYLPMRDFRYSLPRKKLYASDKKIWNAVTPEVQRLKKKVFARIRAEGPLSARDFVSATDSKGSGWWDWKPAKIALEQLFMEGRLMVSSRKGFQKIYDLTERVLPANIDSSFPSSSEYARHLIENAARSHGLIRADEVAYLRSSSREFIAKEFAKMVRDGELNEIRVEGLAEPYYGSTSNWDKLLNEASEPARFHILSPFDNHVIQRKRLRALFNFDYTIECYVPEAKRQFGYFCLPILHGDRFIGRIDAKAERKEKILVVRALHIEKNCGKKANVWRELEAPLKEFAQFNGCAEVRKGFR